MKQQSIYIVLLFVTSLLGGCTDLDKGNPYEDQLHTLQVTAVYPDEYAGPSTDSYISGRVPRRLSHSILGSGEFLFSPQLSCRQILLPARPSSKEYDMRASEHFFCRFPAGAQTVLSISRAERHCSAPYQKSPGMESPPLARSMPCSIASLALRTLSLKAAIIRSSSISGSSIQ